MLRRRRSALAAVVALLTAVAVVGAGSFAAVRVLLLPGPARAGAAGLGAGDPLAVALCVLLVAGVVVLVVRGVARRVGRAPLRGRARPTRAEAGAGAAGSPGGGTAVEVVGALRVASGTVPGLDGRWRRGRLHPSPGYLRVLPVGGRGAVVTADVVVVRPTGRTTGGGVRRRGVPADLGVVEVHTFDGVVELAAPVADVPALVAALQP